jgi:hypothetical protein
VAKVPIDAAGTSSKMASANVIRWAVWANTILPRSNRPSLRESVVYNMANMGVGVIRGWDFR